MRRFCRPVCSALQKPQTRWATRSLATSVCRASTAADALPCPSPRTLESLKTRVGHCIKFGLTPSQTTEAAELLSVLARDWRAILAGSEGFLTAPDRRGLHRHKVVWGDQDSMGHVNNCVYNKWAESARVNWVGRYASRHDRAHAQQWRDLVSPRGDGLILRRIETDFKFPMKYPDRVSVYHRLLQQPRPESDSFHLAVVILSEKHCRPAARCVEDIVLYDYKTAKKLSLGARPFMLEAFQKTWKLQEQAKLEWRSRVLDLEKCVKRLEVGSWNHADAVEDAGSAKAST